MVSLGLPFQDVVELDEIKPPYDYNGSMDCNDAYFTEYSMRCATLLHQCNANTHTTSVLNVASQLRTIVVSCVISSIYLIVCSLTNINMASLSLHA